MNSKKAIKYSLLSLLALSLIPTKMQAASYNFPPVHFATTPLAADFPDMPAVVLLDTATLEYSKPARGKLLPTAVLSHHRRYKILTTKGQEYATIVLPESAHSIVKEVRGRVVLQDGRVVQLSSSDIQHQPGKTNKELGRVIARLPTPSVGSVVDFWYERQFDDARYVPVWNIGGDLPVKRAEFAIVTPPEVLLDVRHGNGQIISDEQPVRRDLDKGRIRLLWVTSELPPLYPENDMPDLQRLRGWVASVVKGVMIKGESQSANAIKTWEDVGNWYLGETKSLQHLPPVLNWLTQEKDDVKLHSHLQSQATVIDADYLWDVAPATLEDIEKHKTVSSRDMAAFQAAVWRQHGQDAYPALVIRPGGRLLSIDVPSLTPFSNVVVAMKKGEGYLFIDPSCPKCTVGQLPLELQGGAALVVKGPNNVEFVDLPVSTPDQNRAWAEFNFKLKQTGDLEGVFTLRAHGEAARQLRQELAKSKIEQKEALMKALTNKGTTLEISNWEVGDSKNLEAPVRVTGACKAKMKELKYQEYKFTADQVTGEIYHQLWRDKRRYQLGTGGPLTIDLKINIELPVGYTVDEPLPVEIRTDYGHYNSNYQYKGRNFTFERSFVVNKPMIEAQEYGSFLEFIKKTRQAEALGITFLSTEE